MPLASIADLNQPEEVLAPLIAQAEQLSDLYDDMILLEQDGHDRAPGIHASELYPCLRQAVYSIRAVPRKPNVAKFWKQRFKMGSAIHSMLQADFHLLAKRSQLRKAMRVAGRMAAEMDCTVYFEDEVKLHPDKQALAAHYNIHSSCDGVFTFVSKQTLEVMLRVGLEIKSEAPDGFEKLKEPKPEHIRQGHLYMACLDLPIMWFLYMNKGNQNNTKSMGPWMVRWQPAIWAELEARIQEAHTFAANNQMPPRTETIVCEFCAWSYDCQPNNMMKSMQKNSANTNKKTSFRR